MEAKANDEDVENIYQALDDLDLSTELVSGAEAPENIAEQNQHAEPSSDVVRQIEAQDLPFLETELYEEPIETPENKPQMEAEIESLCAEMSSLREELDDPVFWQKAENELIEKPFGWPEPLAEPEPDEYDY